MHTIFGLQGYCAKVVAFKTLSSINVIEMSLKRKSGIFNPGPDVYMFEPHFSTNETSWWQNQILFMWQRRPE